MRPHRGVLILVFGILSLVICPFFGVAAWMMGNADLHDMAMGRMDTTGKDMTKAGRICGIVGTAFLIFQVVLVIIMGFGMAMFRATAP